jgi:hypothetical protein
MTRWAVTLGVIAFCAGFWTLIGCAAESYVKRPPVQFQHPGTYPVKTVATADIAKACAGVSVVGERPGPVLACYRPPFVILPNFCEWPGPIADIACHEIGHANGWPADHGLR